MKTLSFIVPVYNAQDLARKLSLRLPDLKEVAYECGFELIESIFVDDGSNPKLVDLDGVKILHHEKNMGKGMSVRDAFLEAKGDWVLMSDVDESVPVSQFQYLASRADDNVWIVCGSRRGRPGVPIKRKILSKIFSFFASLIMGNRLMDTQCGFKPFHREKMRPIFENLMIKRFAFDVELITTVIEQGGEVVEQNVSWHGGKRSSLNVLKDAPRMLIDLIRLKLSKKGRDNRG